MTNNSEQPVWHIGIIFVVACFLFAALVAIVKFSTATPAIDADRGAVLAKSLAQIHATESKTLNAVAWVDESRGVVHLPIETAIQMVAGKSAAAVRADLIARTEKIANTAPKVIQKTSAFE